MSTLKPAGLISVIHFPSTAGAGNQTCWIKWAQIATVPTNMTMDANETASSTNVFNMACS